MFPSLPSGEPEPRCVRGGQSGRLPATLRSAERRETVRLSEICGVSGGREPPAVVVQ